MIWFVRITFSNVIRIITVVSIICLLYLIMLGKVTFKMPWKPNE